MNGIIGAIVGNSVGQSYEIIKTRDYNFNMIYDKGNAADDSVAILAVADWLMSTAHTNDALIDKLHFWCNKFNYGMYNYGNEIGCVIRNVNLIILMVMVQLCVLFLLDFMQIL